MPRPQFSLKTLLWLMAVVGIVLGSAHLIKTYGQFVEARQDHPGSDLTMDGRLIDFFGPAKHQLVMNARRVGTNGGDPDSSYGRVEQVERSWLCAYNITGTFRGFKHPGEFVLTLHTDFNEDKAPIRKSWLLGDD